MYCESCSQLSRFGKFMTLQYLASHSILLFIPPGVIFGFLVSEASFELISPAFFFSTLFELFCATCLSSASLFLFTSWFARLLLIGLLQQFVALFPHFRPFWVNYGSSDAAPEPLACRSTAPKIFRLVSVFIVQQSHFRVHIVFNVMDQTKVLDIKQAF